MLSEVLQPLPVDNAILGVEAIADVGPVSRADVTRRPVRTAHGAGDSAPLDSAPLTVAVIRSA